MSGICMNTGSKVRRTYVISQAFRIVGRGTGVVFEGDPPILLPFRVVTVAVSTPAGRQFQTKASYDAALKDTHNEVLAMGFRDCEPADLPPGTEVEILIDPLSASKPNSG